ncbi:MAG TPA: iron dependent repressor, metal binding and dimerization domain protein [Clostridia bacterium]|nr:iron dependent repressor, metal binding and dimerization domain protein [Clostridia bacterium]
MDDNKKFHTVRGYQILDQNKKLLTSGMEDYLEMIYRNSLIDGYMRINTLSELLNVQASSTTKMVQKLTVLGLLDYKKYGIIFLTKNGKEIGKYLLERHYIIENFLKFIGVGESVLQETELIEHYITESTLRKIELINNFFNNNPEYHKKFEQYKKNATKKAIIA